MSNKIPLLLASIYLLAVQSVYGNSNDWLEVYSSGSDGILYIRSKPSRVPKQRNLVNYFLLLVPSQPLKGIAYSVMFQSGLTQADPPTPLKRGLSSSPLKKGG
jgi:hypothetical protein